MALTSMQKKPSNLVLEAIDSKAPFNLSFGYLYRAPVGARSLEDGPLHEDRILTSDAVDHDPPRTVLAVD